MESARGVLGRRRLRVECKTPRFCPAFAPICPAGAPYCPGFTSQNPRFASYAMERRGWESRFSAKFGTGFACRGEEGWFQRRERRERRGRIGRRRATNRKGNRKDAKARGEGQEGGFNAETAEGDLGNPSRHRRASFVPERRTSGFVCDYAVTRLRHMLRRGKQVAVASGGKAGWGGRKCQSPEIGKPKAVLCSPNSGAR